MAQRPYYETVKSEWTDYNGHMNVAYYVLVFDHASDAFFESVDLGEAYRARSGFSIFAVEAHVTYDREVHAGAPLAITSRPLEVGRKTLRLFHRMDHAEKGFTAATNEVMILHVDMTTRKTTPWPEDGRARLEAAVAAHPEPWPAEAGRAIGMR